MCNCGNKRNELKLSPNKTPGHVAIVKNASRHWKDVAFEYTGSTGLVVTGSVTGRRYRFQQSGDVQLIDYRDASAMMGVPVLKKV